MTALARITVLVFTGILALLATSNTVMAGDGIRPHIAFNLASHHIGASQNFEEFNPGVGIGFTLPVTTSGTEIAGEIGQYHNSVGGNSVYVTGSLDTPVAQVTPSAQLRLGTFGGLAYYEEASRKFKGGGIPMIGDWVVVGGAQATLRINERYDIRARILPAGKAADAIATLQMAVRF